MRRLLHWLRPPPAPATPPPAPRSPRELLLSLCRYDDTQGMAGWLDGFDYRGVGPHQAYYAVLGRLPESARVAAQPEGYDARRHFEEMLLSSEFQGRLMARVLRAFPERKRLFFVHVPKCAGSDLAAHLFRRHEGAYLGPQDESPLHIAPERLPWRLQMLVAGHERHDTLAVLGHIGLHWVLSEKLLRFGDTAFSVIRDPIDMAVSKVNYVLTQLLGRGEHPPAHFPAWMEMLGLSGFPQAMDEAEARATARRLLRAPRVVPHNNICRFLGRDDAASTFDLCAAADIELTTVSRYPAWLRQRWGIDTATRLNESHPYLRREELDAADLAHLHDITAEDRIVHQRLEARLAASSQLSLPGSLL